MPCVDAITRLFFFWQLRYPTSIAQLSNIPCILRNNSSLAILQECDMSHVSWYLIHLTSYPLNALLQSRPAGCDSHSKVKMNFLWCHNFAPQGWRNCQLPVLKLRFIYLYIYSFFSKVWMFTGRRKMQQQTEKECIWYLIKDTMFFLTPFGVKGFWTVFLYSA